MTHHSSVALIDSVPGTRARLSRTLAELGYYVEPYESLEDLQRYWPNCGLMLVRDEGDLIETVLDLSLSQNNWSPLVAFGHQPSAARVCEMIMRGALGYLAEPLDPDLIKRYLEQSDVGLRRVVDQARRRTDATRKIAGLTDRERDVLRLVIVGDSNKDIGNRLSISPRTVEIHRANMIRKIGARSTGDAIRIAVDCDLDWRVEA